MSKEFNPLVTFFIPSYNHAKYVEKSIVSVCEQTYENLEVIIIDDGSTDGSHDLILELQKKYNFKYIHRPNKGLIKTLNEALEIAKGEYICWGGSDDIFLKDKAERQVAFLKENPDFVLCYGKMTFINNQGGIIKNAKSKHSRSGFVFDSLLQRCFITLPTVMIKTSIIREFGGFDERFFLEDYPLWLKISKKYQIGFLDEFLTYYRLHDSNVSSNLVKMVKEVERILYDWKDEPIYEKTIAKWYYRWFCDLVKTNNRQETKEYMSKALARSFYKPRFIKNAFKFYIKGLTK